MKMFNTLSIKLFAESRAPLANYCLKIDVTFTCIRPIAHVNDVKKVVAVAFSCIIAKKFILFCPSPDFSSFQTKATHFEVQGSKLRSVKHS